MLEKQLVPVSNFVMIIALQKIPSSSAQGQQSTKELFETRVTAIDLDAIPQLVVILRW
jgi:hypothetical protein